MSIFIKLGEIYNEIDREYATKEILARSKGHNRIEAKYAEKRQFNDQAYFLYMFTRLEDRIRELSNNLISTKLATLTSWKLKRTWDIADPNNLHFMKRVALLTEKGNSDYNLISQYYAQRNNIAHGRNFTIPISIPTVIIDMTRLFSDLNVS